MAERKRVLLIAPLPDPGAEELLAHTCEVRRLSQPHEAALLDAVSPRRMGMPTPSERCNRPYLGSQVVQPGPRLIPLKSSKKTGASA